MTVVPLVSFHAEVIESSARFRPDFAGDAPNF
jgi:hypothetical protein